MAFTDVTLGSRVIQEGLGPMKITLSEAVKVGDMIVYNSGWVEADASTYAECSGTILIAGQPGASGDIITAYTKARISGLTTGTAGNEIYLSDTQGDYSADAGTVVRVVGFEIGDGDIWVDPNKLAGQFLTAAGKLSFRDSGIYINSGADGKLTIASDGTGADDITLSGSITLDDNILVANGKALITEAANNKDFSLNAYLTGATGYGKMIEIQSVTGATAAVAEMGFFGVTPVVQQTAVNQCAASITVVTAAINSVLTQLQALGLQATT